MVFQMQSDLIVIAMGGNAFLKKGEPDDISTQWRNVKKSVKGLADLIEKGYSLVITHGNGPQVGKILEWVSKQEDFILPIDIAVAMTQGWLGYMIEISLKNELIKRGLNKEVVCIVNNILVDKSDEAFIKPSKPIGSYYSKEEAKKLTEKFGWVMSRDVRGGYRRVVPSPEPMDNLEISSIKHLVDNGYIVIACGGGGIPIIKNEEYKGVDAVIDKDLASSLLASRIGAKYLMILTDVEGIYRNYGKENMELIKEIHVSDLEKLYSYGEFPPGSMGPKVLACIKFLKNGGERAMIGHLEDASEILRGKKGTQIYK